MRLPQGSVASFDAAEPWQVAAALQVGPYAPPDDGSSTASAHGRGVTSRRGGPTPSYPHPRSQHELLRARWLHAKDPARYPAPQPIRTPGTGAVRSALSG